MSRYAHIAFLLYLAAGAGLIAVIVYKILTDVSVPLFGAG